MSRHPQFAIRNWGRTFQLEHSFHYRTVARSRPRAAPLQSIKGEAQRVQFAPPLLLIFHLRRRAYQPSGYQCLWPACTHTGLHGGRTNLLTAVIKLKIGKLKTRVRSWSPRLIVLRRKSIRWPFNEVWKIKREWLICSRRTVSRSRGRRLWDEDVIVIYLWCEGSQLSRITASNKDVTRWPSNVSY